MGDPIKELNAYSWQYHQDRLDNLVSSGDYEVVNLWWQHEFEFKPSKKFVEAVNEKNIKVNLITCTGDLQNLQLIVWSTGIKKDLVNISIWPEFWFLRTHNELLINNNIYKDQIVTNQYDYNFSYPYLTFNGRTRPHRSAWIDLLYKENLIDEGIVTYHQTHTQEPIKWQHYTGEVRTIEDNYSTNFSSYDFNYTFLQSFLHVPTESDINALLISEKTAQPMLCKLPFLTLGSVNFHKKLQGMGFELYDEIFDYSFDTEKHLTKRIENLVKNVHFVVNKSHLLNDLYNYIKPKIIKNYEHIMDEYVSKFDHVPQMVKNRYDVIIKPESIIEQDDAEMLQIGSRFKDIEIQEAPKKVRRDRIFFDYWYDDFNFESVLSELSRQSTNSVVVLGENEWEPWVTENFLDYLREHNNVKLTITTGGLPSEPVNDILKSYGVNNIKLEHWPTFYFHFTYNNFKHWNFDFDNHVIDRDKITHPFICLNHRGHDHRCHLIDNIFKLHLEKKGIFSWHDTFDESKNFPFKWYNGVDKFHLKDDFIEKMDSYIIPKEYDNCFFDFVSEATDKTVFITEKTIKAILWKKPFAVFGAPGFHAFLQELGFELFEEIIDYSFDQELDTAKRAEMYTQQMFNLIGKQRNYPKLYKKLLPKIMHNYNQYYEVIKHDSYIPSTIQEEMNTIDVTVIDDFTENHKRKFQYIKLNQFNLKKTRN